MADDPDRDLAIGEHVLGFGDAARRREVEQVLDEDASARRGAALWEDRLGRLSSVLPPDAPPPELFQAIADRIDREIVGSDRALTVRSDAIAWEQILPGVQRKVLHHSWKHGRRAVLLRLAPGAMLPAHEYAGLEECLVLEGEVRVAEVVVRAGDFHLVEAGTRHADIHSPGGALLYIARPLAA